MLGIRRVHEAKHLGKAVEIAHQALLGGHTAAHKRKNHVSKRPMILKKGSAIPAEQICAPAL